jgi:hypothetical protein
MAKALFLVINSLNDWWVDFEGEPHGPCGTRESAALRARSLAQFQSTSNGRDTEVLVPDGDGRYWVIWSSRHAEADGQAFVPRRVGT